MTEFRQAVKRIFWLMEGSPYAKAIHLRPPLEQQGLLLSGWRSFCSLFSARFNEDAREMAKRNTGFVQNLQFVDLELTLEDKRAVSEWNVSDDELIAYLERRGEEGYKFGGRYDPQRGNWIFSLTCTGKDDPNKDMCLSAFGGSWIKALKSCAYKDTIILKGGWGTKPDNAANPYDFG